MRLANGCWKVVARGLAVAAVFGSGLQAQDIAGDWQGTLQAGKGLRLVLKVSKTEGGGSTAAAYSIDQTPDPMPVTSISLEAGVLKFSIASVRGTYEGKLSADGNSIQGFWTQNNGPRPLDFQRVNAQTEWKTDPSPHTVQFVDVDKDVKLEVLDWGGTGRPLIFLAGLGGTAHVFDKFALNFIGSYHVYGITRRGFGASSAPTPTGANYSADRLGDDVLAVMDALKLERPVIAGHSIAGEELSSIGSRHPERVAALVYLDAGYPYAFYDSAKGNLEIDLMELRKKLDTMMPGAGGGDRQATIQELLDTFLPQFEKDLREQQKQMTATVPGVPQRKEVPVPPKVLADYVGTYQLGSGLSNSITVKNGQLMTQLTGQDQFPMFAESDTMFFLKVVDAEVEFARDPNTHAVTQLTQYQNGRAQVAKKTSNEPPKASDVRVPPQQAIAMAIIGGEQKYTSIACPVLAIYAVPHDTGSAGDPAARAAQEAQDLAQTGAQADAFEKGVPSARVVRIAHASHAVFTSNETQVLQEMNVFMAKLPK